MSALVTSDDDLPRRSPIANVGRVQERERSGLQGEFVRATQHMPAATKRRMEIVQELLHTQHPTEFDDDLPR